MLLEGQKDEVPAAATAKIQLVRPKSIHLRILLPYEFVTGVTEQVSLLRGDGFREMKKPSLL